ncbi:MAG: BTAD domain-containing putative transcriptional regulator [Candidatus Promineifilaceae bacterium]|nr:BTAD domain-containing putative transcriptional regulator [Candidatus Promineifilaceae bacterium]
METEAQLKVSLLGGFSLVYQGQPIPGLHGDRPISLLAYLLLHRQTAVSRQQLAFTLWPDSSDSQARTNLRNLFYTLRHTLPDADSFLAADTMTLQWREDADVELDVAQFEVALAAAKTAVSAQEQALHLETALSLYKGDLLPGNYDDWIIPIREDLRQAFQDALHQLLHLLQQIGDYRAAARAGQRLIQHDPLDEPAYVQLMRLHALNGDRAGVRRVYDACVLALRRDLDVEPSPATEAAYKELLQLETSPSGPQRVPFSAPIRPSPLPAATTLFVGRETELAQIAERLADPDCRLLTIVGPGGIGKTRLALHAAAGHIPVFDDGAAWVPLNALQTPEQLAAALAQALNFRLRGAANVETELFPLLAPMKMLLVLDNFEQLLPAADFLTRLLERTTELKLLVTSRQALELPQEWRFDLGALPLPEEVSADALVDNSAVQLFVQSGRRAAGSFAPTEADYPLIAHICELVGGMPLGIELAASWLRLLSCAEIAQEIEKNLDFLTVTLHHLPQRHRSLRDLFEYSWRLLTREEQQILLRLSIFRGGFTREAAQQVAAADLQQLAALVDRTLVQRTAVGRYSLHNVIRTYAADHLQADPAAAAETARRHSSHFLRWLAKQDGELRGAGQKGALTAAAADLANIRLAWQRAAAQQESELLFPAAFPLFYFYEVRGFLSEGEAALRLAADSLSLAAGPADLAAQQAVCALHIYQAFLGFRQGKVAAAHALLQSAVAELETAANKTLLSHALCYLGIVEWALGHFSPAAEYLQSALTLALEQGDEWETVMAQVYLSLLGHDQGRLEEARRQLTAVLPTAEKLGDPRLLANFLLISGRINLLLGYLTDAERQLAHCLERAHETRDPNGITYALLYLGMVKQAQGDLTEARQLIGQSMALYVEFNDRVGLERAWVTMGYLEIAAENLEAAHSYFLSFLRVTERVHSLRYLLVAMVGMAVVHARSGDAFTALAWSLAVQQHPSVDWESRQRAQTLAAELQQVLTPEAISQAEKIAAEKTFPAVLEEIRQSEISFS